MFFKYLLIWILLLCSTNIFADILTAKSVSQQDVQDAINLSKDGDVVMIPGGVSTWNNQVVIENLEITLIGAGKDHTIIKKVGGAEHLLIHTYGKPFRITGLCLDGNYESNHILIKNGPKNFRIDNNKFINSAGRSIVIESYAYGVIDHNEFLDNAVTDIVIYGDNDAAWARPVVMGGPEYVFIEDNTFVYTGNGNDAGHSVSANHGARYVFRNNTINSIFSDNFHLSAPIDVHGNFFYGRGSVAFEIYNNTINSEHSYRGMFIRGGTGLIYNNNFYGDFTRPIHLTNYRSAYTPGNEPSGGCPITDYDPYYCSDDYPCIDQIKDLYIWNNKYNEIAISAVVDDRGYNTVHIQENRDYFHYAKPGYNPYTYPHPLIESSSSVPQPLNIKVLNEK